PLEVKVDSGTVDDAGKMCRATVRGEAPARTSHRFVYVVHLRAAILRNSRTNTKDLYTEGVLLDDVLDASLALTRWFTAVYRCLPGDAIRLIVTRICGRKRRRKEIRRLNLMPDTKGLKGQRPREAYNGGRGNESCEHYRSPYPSYSNSRRFGHRVRFGSSRACPYSVASRLEIVGRRGCLRVSNRKRKGRDGVYFSANLTGDSAIF
ncbi:hypothetical protein ALC56_00202, partial [Trachymyrmex septentrionalis]